MGELSGRAEWEAVDALFDRAMEQPPSIREQWVRSSADRDVAREVLALLAAAGRQGILDGTISDAFGSLPPLIDVEGRLRAALSDRYVIDRLLGEGGMAMVFLARELKHERSVVLKVLRPEVAGWIGADRFLAEIQILARLSHPHILALIDSGNADGLLYYVMPYVGGETLRERLSRGPMTAAEALPILRDISAALAHAHAQQLVHRDLKPDNILIVEGHAFLMDFGIAKLRPDTLSDIPRATIEGIAIGTPAYMAPEQAAGRAVDVRADLFSWGIVAREVLAGRPDGPVRYATPVPAPLRRLIDRCLEDDPVRRPLNGAALQLRIDAIAKRGTRDGRRTLQLALGAAATVLVLAVAGFVWKRMGRNALAEGRLAGPVMVVPLANETGDPALAVWGRMAGDWLTQGLHQTGRASVIPWPATLHAVEATQSTPAAGTLRALAQETGANTIVTGAYYLAGSDVRFQVQVTDMRRDVVLATLPAIEVPRDSIRAGIQQLRERLMGMLAIGTDQRLASVPGAADQPPTYEAYRHFERGIDRFNALDYEPATEAFLASWRSDTTFVIPLVYAATGFINRSRYAQGDSIVRALRKRPGALNPYHELMVRYIEAALAGDARRALDVTRQAAALAPGGRAEYLLAFTALSVGQAEEAIAVLRAVDPSHGVLKGWSPYWFVLTHAQHLRGEYRDELAATLELRRLHPENRAAWVHHVRALASLGDTARADSVVAAASGLPPDTYWSQGAMLVTIGEELDAHGFAGSARYYAAAIDWFRSQLTRDSTYAAHRYWIGSAHLDRGAPAAAAPYFASLVRDVPENVQYRGLWGVTAALAGDTALARQRLGDAPPYRKGDHLAFLARYASVANDRERAIALWSQAVSTGLSGIVWLHASAQHELSHVAGDRRFRQLGIIPPRRAR